MRKKNLELVIETLEEIPISEQEKFVDNSISNLASTPFNFNSHLLKLKLYKFSSKKYVLGLVVNHLIFDGESLPNFIKQLAHFYSYKKTDKLNFTSFSFSEINSFKKSI